MKYSIILTVHNKENLIVKVLDGVLENTTGDYEFIIVLDGCTDRSEELLAKWAESLSQDTWDKIEENILVLHTENVFETRANNAGLKVAKGEYAIILQDDCVLKEKGWNERLCKPLEVFDDIFAVTARCAHNWDFNPDSQDIKHNSPIDNRWCDILYHSAHAERNSGLPRNIFAIRDSVNRGPLALKLEVVEKLDYLDEIYSPQMFDEHDLCFRAYEKFGLKSGCYWVDYESDPTWGGTRNSQGQTKPWAYLADHKNSRIFYNRWKNRLGQHYNESRVLE